jgi:hypothetical protein
VFGLGHQPFHGLQSSLADLAQFHGRLKVGLIVVRGPLTFQSCVTTLLSSMEKDSVEFDFTALVLMAECQYERSATYLKLCAVKTTVFI